MGKTPKTERRSPASTLLWRRQQLAEHILERQTLLARRVAATPSFAKEGSSLLPSVVADTL
jgi:hypothetical protein